MEINLEERQGVRLAIEGCGHGTLHAIYASVTEACERKGWPGVDLLIIGGDFQSVRNAYDLNCVSMPAKYRAMCDFHEYYSGHQTAPYLTVFVGGNHEASNYLFELYYGGWVAPNIYYMGAANVLRLGPLRLAGMSGIWKGYNYRKNHHERIPYSENDLKSIYHVRELDVRKLLHIRSQVDIGISHDWPKGVEWKGNHRQLFRFKPYLEEDAKSGQLGSVAARQVMDWLRPRLWFSAHLHCKYAAVIEYGAKNTTDDMKVHNDDEIALEDDSDTPSSAEKVSNVVTAAWNRNADEIDLEDDKPVNDETFGNITASDGDSLHGQHSHHWPYTQSLEAATAALPASFRREAPSKEKIAHPEGITNERVHFLALDKCLPGKQFLQLTPVSTGNSSFERPLQLAYDSEWLAITRAFAISEPLILGNPDRGPPPSKQAAEYYSDIDKQVEWLEQHMSSEDLLVPKNFQFTSPVYDGGTWSSPAYRKVEEYPNPQTDAFCQLLAIPNAFAITPEEREARLEAGPPLEENAGERSSKGHRGRGGPGNGRGRAAGRRGRGRGSFHGKHRG